MQWLRSILLTATSISLGLTRKEVHAKVEVVDELADNLVSSSRFVIDFDLPASLRYNDLYSHFQEGLLTIVEGYWHNFYSDEIRQWYTDHIDELKKSQPDAYEASLALASVLGLPVAQTMGVSMVADHATFCISIVARNQLGQIAHVRNLDFYFTELGQGLIYEAILVKDGIERARAPLIAGFYGVFTGRKPGSFSVSYNVRESHTGGPTQEEILENLARNLDPEYTPQSTLLLEVLLEAETFSEAVSEFSERKITANGHFIIGGVTGNEGVVVSRGPDTVVNLSWLSPTNWYVAMTNLDVWSIHDSRYQSTVSYLEALGQDGVSTDGHQIIKEVLWQAEVLDPELTVFTTTISAANNQESVSVYMPPKHTKPGNYFDNSNNDDDESSKLQLFSLASSLLSSQYSLLYVF